MATLHAVIENTKSFLKWGGISIGIILLLFILYKGGLFIKEKFFPTPPTPATVLFGKLPEISFPQTSTTKKLSYVIDTVTGKLPVFFDEEKRPLDRMNVYKVTHGELTLLDLQNTKNQVARAGFGGGIQLEGTSYRFQKADSLQKTMDIDVVSKNFTITSAFAFNQTILDAHNIPDPTSATEGTENFLKTIGIFPQDIDTKKTKAQMLKLKNGILFDSDNLSDTQIVRVDYFQKDLNDFPIYYPKGIYSTMNFLVASSDRGLNIVQSEFYHQTISDQSATYPLKPVQTAYDELTKGKGYIAANFVKGNTINIKDVFLGYYASNMEQSYLLPIYIFKGREDEFYAYVPAIADTWITNSSTTPSEQNK